MIAVRAVLAAVDRGQQRHRPTAVLVAVLKKFSDDEAGSRAALIAYFGFFSLFPLLLLFVAILGFVLGANSAAERAVLHSALRQFPPILGGSLGAGRTLRGSGVGLAVGAVGALLSGLGVTMAAETAFNTVYAVPRRRRPSFLAARVRGLELLAVVGMLQVVSTTASGAVAAGLGGALVTVAGIAVSLALNLLMFFTTFRMLVGREVPTRELWPGIALAAVVWEVLQSVGGLYIGHVVKGASSTYGTFDLVIGLLVWLYLGARILVYSAELNVVLARRLWPRSLFGPAARPADRRTIAALAKTEERDGGQHVEVTFHPLDATAGGPGGCAGADRAEPDYAVAPQPAPGERARSTDWPRGRGGGG